MEFDGTEFHGWQLQDGIRTVQSELEAALQRLTCREIRVRASSRTDAGVHACALPVIFDTDHPIPLMGIVKGLNSHLPEDLSVVRAALAPEDFDVRGRAKEKTYRYCIWNSRARSAHRRRDHWHVPMPLDPHVMQRAASALLGEHDFSAYRTAQCQAKHAIRRVSDIQIIGEGGGAIHIDVRGNAFLHNMVRIIAGTLVDIGRGHLEEQAAGVALLARDRSLAGQTAPGHGLTLLRVDYESCPFDSANRWP